MQLGGRPTNCSVDLSQGGVSQGMRHVTRDEPQRWTGTESQGSCVCRQWRPTEDGSTGLAEGGGDGAQHGAQNGLNCQRRCGRAPLSRSVTLRVSGEGGGSPRAALGAPAKDSVASTQGHGPFSFLVIFQKLRRT